MTSTPFFTVFVPTYNRAYTLKKTLLSCNASTFKDFEVVLVDDGSSDDTQQQLIDWKKEFNYKLRDFHKENGGKHTAHNLAVTKAKGFLFLTLDSDDQLTSNALQDLYDAWHSIPEESRDQYVSVEGFGSEEGYQPPRYPDEYFDSTYLEIKKHYPSIGEKRSAYKLTVLKDFPFPVFPGERFCRPGMIEMRIARAAYKTRFTAIKLMDVGHEEDGICVNRRKIVVSAPRAYRQYFLEEITHNAAYNSRKSLNSFYKRFIRSSFNAGIGIKTQKKEVPSTYLWLKALPEGWLGSLSDRFWKYRNITRNS